MNKFEKYLYGQLNYVNQTLSILESSKDYDNMETVAALKVHKELLEDIIHHYELFVKREDETDL